jgi:CHAT domain-containing protein
MATWRLVFILAACLPSVGDRQAESWEAAYQRSIQWFNHAEFENAREVAETKYHEWRGHPRARPYWLFRLSLAESLIELDRLKDALSLLETPAPFSAEEARRQADLAMVHFRKHDGLAGQCLAKAQDLVPPNARDLQGQIDLTGGMLQMSRDRLADAEFSFRRALAAVEGSQSVIECYTLGDLGFLHERRFRYDEALYWYGRARDLALRNTMRRPLELAFGNLGVTYFNLGDFDRANENLGKALALAEALDDRVFRVRWLVGQGETLAASGDLKGAASCYRKVLSLGNPELDKEWLADDLDALSRLALKSGDVASAEDLNAKSTALARQLESAQPTVTASIQTAAIAKARREYSKAEKIYNDALAASRQAADPVTTFLCHAGLAALYRQTGNGPSAKREYRAASAAISDLHSSLQQDESKFSLFSSLIDFYHDYVDFLFDAGDSAAAFRVAESSRARVLEERLHRDEGGAPAADLGSLKEEARASGAVLLSYWLAPRRSLLWVIDSAGLHSYQLPPEAEIAAQVRRYNDAIQRGDNPIEGGSDAGRWLFANLLATYRVPKNSNVVIEADGALHQLNFESLPADGGGHYWIDDATISVAPSLALLQMSAYASGGRLLAFGDPGYEGTEFQRLSNAKAELQAVESHFPEKAVYVASAATPAAYREAHSENYSILHFATHAVANRESPLDSAIVLAGPPDSRKLYAREILERRLTADLVTLSACQTAGSRTYYGEGLTGFSWAFLSAGARNVVAGLWDVDDRATAELMKNFYDELASGPAPVSALRRAKLRLIASGGAYRKPRYWAAFETFTRAIY